MPALVNRPSPARASCGGHSWGILGRSMQRPAGLVLMVSCSPLFAFDGTCPLSPQYVSTLWAPLGVRVGQPSFPILCSPRDLLKSLGFHGPCPRRYPVSIAETHPLVVHEPNEVHGWFLSVRASEALSHQSFAILCSLKAAKVTLRTSSYLRIFGTSSIKIWSDHPGPTTQKKYMVGLLYISKTRGPHTYDPNPNASSTDKRLLAPIQVIKYVHLPVLYPTPTLPEDTGY
ncbi:hypothetical protein M9H77_26749 [Catharanthus roseus]|uniref:Uncharacterized protein n=1 Tax=Catharanthus roseus TaxID=4058 RepID=A0ACC0AB16_CATRO|nr:hypothetical protein M9H77_26749 [Catharanthus roseus]